jgi:uncharacterized protein Yka (UPF0111/DUF47 family)
MTIDERIERLTDRHEALAQSVELLVAENRHTSEQIQRMAEENQKSAEENRRRDRQLGDIMEGIARLLHVAEIHERRITDLEGERS